MTVKVASKRLLAVVLNTSRATLAADPLSLMWVIMRWAKAFWLPDPGLK